MRNLHNIIRSEFGWESVTILRKWEQLEKKIADYKNHRRFTLRCLSQKINPNSLKLKSNIKTPRGKRILYRAEKQLADECIRSINILENMDGCANKTGVAAQTSCRVTIQFNLTPKVNQTNG